MAKKNGSERHPEEVKMETSTLQRNRTRVALENWLSSRSAPLSIDVLLTRPIDSLRMALSVGVASGQIPKPMHELMLRQVHQLEATHRQSIVAINEICARAMNGRKRGLFKTNGRRPHRQRPQSNREVSA